MQKNIAQQWLRKCTSLKKRRPGGSCTMKQFPGMHMYFQVHWSSNTKGCWMEQFTNIEHALVFMVTGRLRESISFKSMHLLSPGLWCIYYLLLLLCAICPLNKLIMWMLLHKQMSMMIFISFSQRDLNHQRMAIVFWNWENHYMDCTKVIWLGLIN